MRLIKTKHLSLEAPLHEWRQILAIYRVQHPSWGKMFVCLCETGPNKTCLKQGKEHLHIRQLTTKLASNKTPACGAQPGEMRVVLMSHACAMSKTTAPSLLPKATLLTLFNLSEFLLWTEVVKSCDSLLRGLELMLI